MGNRQSHTSGWGDRDSKGRTDGQNSNGGLRPDQQLKSAPSVPGHPEVETRADENDDIGTDKSVSIIVPTYNEAPNIRPLLDRVLTTLEGVTGGIEVIIVDDDSPDRTWEIAAEYAEKDSRVRVIRRFMDKGLAQAVTDGFHAARNDYVAVIDADCQHPPEKLPLFFAILDGADMVIGSRHVEGGGSQQWWWLRKVVSRGATSLAKVALSEVRKCSDPMSGFFAARRELLEGVDLDPRGYKILLELLVKCRPETVAEVPYIFENRQRGESKLTAGEYQSFVEHIVQLFVMSNDLDRYIDPRVALRAVEFAFVGAIGVVVNMLIFTIVAIGLGANYLFAGAMAFIVAVNWNFIGNWALTFDRPEAALWSQYLKFCGVALVGLGVHSLILAGSVGMLQLPKLLGNAVAIAGTAVFNFTGSHEFAFDVDEDRDRPNAVRLSEKRENEEVTAPTNARSSYSK